MHDDLGLSPERIMDIVGWKTMAMFRRYHIGSEKSARRTGRELDAAMASKLAERDVAEPPGSRRVM